MPLSQPQTVSVLLGTPSPLAPTCSKTPRLSPISTPRDHTASCGPSWSGPPFSHHHPEGVLTRTPKTRLCAPFALFFFFFSFKAAPVACASSRARGQIRTTAAGLHHSHGNEESKPHLPATQDPKPTERGQGSNLHPHGHYGGYLTHWATTETPLLCSYNTELSSYRNVNTIEITPLSLLGLLAKIKCWNNSFVLSVHPLLAVSAVSSMVPGIEWVPDTYLISEWMNMNEWI